jgi:DNA mismatch repair protein MutL
MPAMARVRLLPDILAHKIAAGEVVERPASVVKELLENSLDSEARRIVVEAEEGGKRLIVVRDDGIGMSPEDARLAFQHHATSKIQRFEDLSHLQTLGFRGEALPSIASVSRLRLRTVERATAGSSTPLGSEIDSEGGELKEVKEISWPTGTEVRVEDLFFNVPVRREFLKRTSTELGHLSRQVMNCAIAYPHVAFDFQHQGKSLVGAAAVDNLEDRIHQVFGASFLENLVRVNYKKNGITLSGFVSLPHEQRTSSRSQFLYVNRRMVRDRILTHAVRLAYQDLIPSNAYPAVILFLELDPEQVDVNVHPCKTEIRFRHSNSVHQAIRHGIEEALLGEQKSLSDLARDLPGSGLRPYPGNGLARSTATVFQRHSLQGTPFPALGDSKPTLPGVVHENTLPSFSPAAKGTHGEEIPETDYIDPVPVVLGQFVESFVVSVDREGVLLVDQHVAHERILYDQALHQMESPRPCATQRLLIPLTHELNFHQKAICEQILDLLNANGFEVEWFGEQTLVIKGVPSFAGECDVQLLIEGILDELTSQGAEGVDENTRMNRLRQKIAISLSCRAAIKINTPLSQEKMQWLLDELFRCDNPFTCPHGRPIVLRMGIEEVLRGFKRI